MHSLLSSPPTTEEIELLKHIDLEKMAVAFDKFLSSKAVDNSN
jgi:hypothetical protein